MKQIYTKLLFLKNIIVKLLNYSLKYVSFLY